MNDLKLSNVQLDGFRDYLYEDEKSEVTITKYLHDVKVFMNYAKDNKLNKELVLGYKRYLLSMNYAVPSMNSMLAALNSFFTYLGWKEGCTKLLKVQKKTYSASEQELSKEEYYRLLKASERKSQLNLVIQTICSTGIRISELRYFTVEAMKSGEVSVRCKNKTRVILIPKKLRKKLLEYVKRNQIQEGCIFITRNGLPLDRSNIWKQMKQLCEAANVNPVKVFPHNLRKLFARTFYKMEKDIAKLADILGHGSINTTRIYIMTTSVEHRRKIERLGLIQ